MKKKRWIYHILLLAFVIVFLVSGTMLIHELYEEKQQEEAFSRLLDVFEEEASDPAGSFQTAWAATASDPDIDSEAADEPVVVSMTPIEAARADWQLRISGYQQLYEQNSDFIGWIRIDGTAINYPVVNTPDRPDYYLKRNFQKQDSAYGVPYVSEDCIVGEEGTNLLIYGHHMKNGSMFAALDGYRDAAFYQEHPYIRFDTVAEAGLYEIAGAWLIANAQIQNRQVEQLFQLLFSENEEAFAQDWNQIQKNLFVNTGISVSYEDKLLALVTCDYSYNDSRIVVIARRLEE